MSLLVLSRALARSCCDLIGLLHNIAFEGRIAIAYDANLFTPPSPWGPFIILVPVVGALCVTFLIVNFAPEAKGHGVPEVSDAHPL